MTWPPPSSSNQPFPTPDSDQPPPHRAFQPPSNQSHTDSNTDESFSPDDAPYDSVLDDLSCILSQSLEKPDPDPFLGEQLASPIIDSSSADSPAPPEPARPRTSEVFRAVLTNPQSPLTDQPPHSAHHPSHTNGHESSTATSLDHSTANRASTVADSGSDDNDDDDHPRASWSQLLLLSYSSAVTLALIWILWTGRAIQRDSPPDREPPPAPTVIATTTDDPRPADPPLPPSNIASIGNPLRMGELEVVALDVTWRPVHLARSINPSEVRKEEHQSLVLRLALKNLATEHSLTPLTRDLVREQSSRPDQSYIEQPDGNRIALFPLALDSEWTIRGQDFSPIEPGQAMLTLVASAPVPVSRLADNQTWRLHVRTGLYKTDVIGIRFSRREVSIAPPEE